ncbi:MAG: ATP-dependent DNA helicase [Pseudomonadota bacterium]
MGGNQNIPPLKPVSLPPALAVGRQGAVLLAEDGAVVALSHRLARERLAAAPHLVLSRPRLRQMLGLDPATAWDVLELYAFVHPARPLVPTAMGLARALDLPAPHGLEGEAAVIRQGAAQMLGLLRDPGYGFAAGAHETAAALARAGWAWGEAVSNALPPPSGRARPLWEALGEWESQPPPPPPKEVTLDPAMVTAALKALLPPDAEEREGQRAYALAAAFAFAPREAAAPNVALAEAGTGIGKTLGYVAPASLWAQAARGTVWIATYTKALQRQIDQELARLYPNPRQRARNAVVRKGRENYLCLLNLEEALAQAGLGLGGDGAAVLLHLVARWARHSRDGDIIGGDFPAWLAGHFPTARLAGLTDRRGECLYSACRHYRRCFIEKSQRAASRAQLVIANHALVMVHARERGSEGGGPTRYVFDEAHHLFDAADAAFSAALTGGELRELRRWLLGPEGARRRGRGLAARIDALISDDDDLRAALNAALLAGRALPGDGWLARVREAAAHGPAEAFLERLRAQVLARARGRDGDHGLEVEATAPIGGLVEAAQALLEALDKLLRPLATLAAGLARALEDKTESLDGDSRARIEGAVRGLRARLEGGLAAWTAMLAGIGGAGEEEGTGFVDWFAIIRTAGREMEVGMFRHLIDPTLPFARLVLSPAQGVLMTSATLRDKAPKASMEEGADWRTAEVRSGATHLLLPPRRTAITSPFAYPRLTRVFVVTDVDKREPGQVAAAYRALFLAAGGGALGLFTAIARLKMVHARLAAPLAKAGLALYAQHVDPIDTGTLIDIFRAEENACLLGTDAVRDGIDVPGRALRLLVFDRVPWPRPTILHRARKAAFGPGYDDLIARLRLTQAYGRLVRRAHDRGVFVILDPAAPLRLFSGLPEGVAITRLSVAQAIAETRAFLNDEEAPMLAPADKLA